MARSRITLDGLPHSEISGSKPVCGSPKLIAAYHVLHRLLAPRHPPYALSSLTKRFTRSSTTLRMIEILQVKYPRYLLTALHSYCFLTFATFGLLAYVPLPYSVFKDPAR